MSAVDILPRLQVVSAWNDPADETTWSGTVSSLLRELGELGALATTGYRDVTPPVAAALAVRRELQLTGRLGDGWLWRPEMRLLTGATAVLARRRRDREVDASSLPLGALGRPVPRPYATWCDMSPAQVADACARFAGSFGYDGASARTVRAVVRQQVRVARAATACLAVSHWAARSLVEDHGIAGTRVHVTGAGMNVRPQVRPGRDWATPRFLFVGNDWARKNGEGVVRAFARLRERVPGAELHVVGKDHPRLDVAGVETHGALSFGAADQRRRLEELFGRATCLVMPSWVEPFGIVHVEAGAAGVPSIGTTVGGTATSIGPGGLRVDPADDAALEAAMAQMAVPTEAAVFGDRARQWSEQFSWRKSAERVLRALAPAAADELGLAEFL
jgi:hypothetical protein